MKIGKGLSLEMTFDQLEQIDGFIVFSLNLLTKKIKTNMKLSS